VPSLDLGVHAAKGCGHPFDRAWIALDLALQSAACRRYSQPRASSYHALPSACVPAGVVGWISAEVIAPATSAPQDRLLASATEGE